MCQSVVSIYDHEQKEPSVMNVTTIGLDLAKTVFQIHGIDSTGDVIIRRSLRRRQMLPFFSTLAPCLIGLEACGTSHFWARELEALGHDVKLMPPAYVKPYVRRGKTDAADAAAICEAVTRPSMWFVPIKSAESQSVLALHRTRDLLVGQRTQLVNMIRSQLAEFGIVLAKGIEHARRLVEQLLEGVVPDIPPLACKIVIALAEQIRELQARIAMIEGEIKAWFHGSALAQRLATIPGIGYLTASALAASVTDPHRFPSARHFAASLGLTPKAHASGGKEGKGRISKMGDRYLRRLLVSGMTSQLHWARRKPEAYPWVAGLLAKGKPNKQVAVAMANKAARIAWVVMTRGEVYRASQPVTEVAA
jgi:transposase